MVGLFLNLYECLSHCAKTGNCSRNWLKTKTDEHRARERTLYTFIYESITSDVSLTTQYLIFGLFFLLIFFCQKSSNMVKIEDETCSICLNLFLHGTENFWNVGFRHLSTTIALLVIQSYCNKCHRSKFLFDRLYSGLVLVIHTTLPRTLWCWEIPVVLTTRVWNNTFWCQSGRTVGYFEWWSI